MVQYAGSLICIVHADNDLDPVQGQGHVVMTISPLPGPFVLFSSAVTILVFSKQLILIIFMAART